MKKYIMLSVIAVVVISAVILMLTREKEPKARIAFIIDDWGYSNKNLSLFFEIDRPVTASILPNLRYSQEIAEEIKKKNNIYDIILHLPLESESNRAAELDTIRGNMPDNKVISLLEKGIDSIPGIIGVSNHQGSKATKNKRLMKLVLNVLKKKKLFFIDSLTTPDSVCSEIAGEINLRFAERDVFLDITDKTDMNNFEAYIKKQVGELARIALDNKKAIGIGHAKSITLKVIKESIPGLEKQGIKIVPLKELVR